jgi:soluble lytic murein transglycosylase-like protein
VTLRPTGETAGLDGPNGRQGVDVWQRGTPARGTTARSMALLRTQALSGTLGAASSAHPAGALGGAGTSSRGTFAGALASAQRPRPAAASAPTSGAVVAVPGEYGSLVNEAAQRHGVDPALVAGVIEAESGFNARAVSPAGAQGLMQLMPGTARGLGVADSLDPTQNVMGGAKLLRQLLDRYKGDTRLALAAYNAGPGAVDKHGGVPPYAETQRYVPKVLAATERYRQSKAGMAPIE